MQSDDIASLLYLVLLGTAIVGWFIAENRKNLGQTARMALAWGLIFLGVAAGYGLWKDVRTEVLPRQSVESASGVISVPRGRDGHFHLRLQMNDTPVDFLVDTGATDIVLTQRDARRVGLNTENLAFVGVARTANGTVRTAYATIDEVSLGGVSFQDVSVAVNEGEMEGSLLGLAYLDRFARLEISNDTLFLTP